MEGVHYVLCFKNAAEFSLRSQYQPNNFLSIIMNLLASIINKVAEYQNEKAPMGEPVSILLC